MNIAQIATDIAAKIEANAHEIEAAADAKIPGLTLSPFGMAIAMADGY
jgi:glutaminase